MTSPNYTGGFALPERLVRVAPSRLAAPSGFLVTFSLLIFGAIWLFHLASTSLSPPVDNIEQLNWVRSLQWGYYKHPPLPTWLLWFPVQLMGMTEWTVNLLGAAVTLAAIGLLWRLLKALRGPKYAALALLSVLCITYYNGRLNYYNHNVVLMLAVVVSAWCCWLAFEERRMRWWLALGVVLGLGALVKYQIAVTVISVLCFWLTQRGWRDPLHVRGLLIAALIALLIFTPHMLWLPANDFGPVMYAVNTSLGIHLDTGERLFNAANWLADQLLNRSLPALVLLGLCAYSVSRRKKQGRAVTTLTAPLNKPGSRALIFSWAVVPLMFMPAVGIVFGSDLQLQWGTAFVLFAVPVSMELMPREVWQRVSMTFALKVFVALQAFLLLLSFVTSPLGLEVLKDDHWRTFKSKTFADEVAGPARARLGGAIRVVIGDGAIAGALALRLAERPLVLIDGHFRTSPWVPEDLVSRCGALEIIKAQQQPVNTTPVGVSFPGIYWRSIQPLWLHRSCPG